MRAIFSDMIKSFVELGRLLRNCDGAALLGLLQSREAPPAIQFLKYALCGGGALVVHVGVYVGLVQVVWPQLQGAGLDDWERARSTFGPTGLAFLVSNAFVYWLNMKWVFTPGRHAPLREFFYFTAVNLPGALSGSFAQAGLVYYWHWPKWAAVLGFVVPNVLINYGCRKFLIFRK